MLKFGGAGVSKYFDIRHFIFFFKAQQNSQPPTIKNMKHLGERKFKSTSVCIVHVVLNR